MRRRDFIAATAAALTVPFASRSALAAPDKLRFRDLYVRGRELTDIAKSLEGREVEMIGYMAPPLKPEIDFFVLTKLPMSVCPFCETEAQWPDDIVLAKTNGPVDVVRYTDLIRTRGTFEIGFKTDEETGFMSYLRIVNATYTKL